MTALRWDDARKRNLVASRRTRPTITTVRSRFRQTCPTCRGTIEQGEYVAKHHDGTWGHPGCPPPTKADIIQQLRAQRRQKKAAGQTPDA